MKSESYGRALLWIVVCVLLAPTGCTNSSPGLEIGKVQGTVRVNGQPQRNTQVLFSPDKEKGNGLPAFAGGVTDDQGNYTLKYSYLKKTGEGAPVGWSRVALTDLSGPKASAIPPDYTMAATSPLLVEVKAGDNKIDLDVKK